MIKTVPNGYYGPEYRHFGEGFWVVEACFNTKEEADAWKRAQEINDDVDKELEHYE